MGIGLDKPDLYPARHAPLAPAAVAVAFGGLVEPTPPPSKWPASVYLSGPDDSWCASRRGIWWPTQGVWVDRLLLDAEDVPPAGARTFTRNPPKGLVLAAVHGQVLGDVAHVLVTGAQGEVILQWSGRFFDAQDRAMLTLTTLVVAAGLADDGAEAIAASLSDTVLDTFMSPSWDAPGWSKDFQDLPGRLLRALGR